MRNVTKLGTLIEKEGSETLKRSELCPTTASIIQEIKPEENEIIPERETRRPASASKGYALFHDYLMKGELQSSLNKAVSEILRVVKELNERLSVRLSPVINDPLFKAMAMFLDTKSYNFQEFEDLISNAEVIVNWFRPLLAANGCNIERIESELDIMFDHVKKFMCSKTGSKVWPYLFSCQHELGIANALHLAEICIAMPMSNAESERVFSFLWRMFSKDRQSLDNSMLENLLRLRCDNDYSAKRYEHAIDLFLSQYPKGEVRKSCRRVDGINYPRKRNCRRVDTNTASVSSVLHELVPSSEEEADQLESVHDINLDDISSDEWSE